MTKEETKNIIMQFVPIREPMYSEAEKQIDKALNDLVSETMTEGAINTDNMKCGHLTTKEITARLEYLRGEIRAEKISYGEIAELQSLAKYIDKGDVELLEWAGVEEFK